MYVLKHSLEAVANPDLGGGGNAGPAVSPLANGVTREAPPHPILPNTPVDDNRYFYCTVPTASMHRKDGKRLPFLNGLLKTNIKEDIEFLDAEIAAGNIYIRKATTEEVDHAKLIEDPMGSVRAAVKAEVMSSFSVEELEKMLAERRAAGPSADAAKIAGTANLNAAASQALQAKGTTVHASATGANTANLGGLIKGK